MKKVILLAACLFTINTVTNAQNTTTPPASTNQGKAHQMPTPEVRAQKNVDKLNAEATLNADQQTKVYQLALTKVKALDAIKTKYKGQPEMKETEKKEMMAVKKEYRESLKTVLTPEQLEKVKASKKPQGEKE